MPDRPVILGFRDGPHANAGQVPQRGAGEHSPPRVLAPARAADMLARSGVAKEAEEIVEVAQFESAQKQPLRLDKRSFGEPPRRVMERKQVALPAYFLARLRPPKRLLKRATWPPVSSSF